MQYYKLTKVAPRPANDRCYFDSSTDPVTASGVTAYELGPEPVVYGGVDPLAKTQEVCAVCAEELGPDRSDITIEDINALKSRKRDKGHPLA